MHCFYNLGQAFRNCKWNIRYDWVPSCAFFSYSMISPRLSVTLRSYNPSLHTGKSLLQEVEVWGPSDGPILYVWGNLNSNSILTPETSNPDPSPKAHLFEASSFISTPKRKRRDLNFNSQAQTSGFKSQIPNSHLACFAHIGFSGSREETDVL